MVLALNLLHAACTLNAPLEVGACVALLLNESVKFGPQTPKHRWPPLNAKAVGKQRGVYDGYRVKSRCSCGSGGVAVLIFRALFGVVGLRETILAVNIAPLW